MNIRLATTLLIIFASGILQAEVSKIFNEHLHDFYEPTFLGALSVSNYAMSLLIPFGLWFTIGLLIHMMTVVIGKEGSVRELYHVSGICYIPFLFNFIFLYYQLSASNENLGDQLTMLTNDPSYDIKISSGIYISTFRNIGTVCSLICIVTYCFVVKSVYRTSTVQALSCISAPIIIFLFFKLILL